MPEPEIAKGREPRLKWPLSRQRLIELAVVVFGVMIALGLDNLVEEIRLHGDARELESAFREEITSAASLSWERQVIAPCLRQQLVALSERVITPEGAAAPTRNTAPGSIRYALPQAYRAPTRVWTTSSFDRALGSEAFKRIPQQRADAYTVVFAQIASRRDDNAAEFFAIAGLAPLAYPQPDLDHEVRADLLQNIALLDRQNAIAVTVSDQIIESAMTLPRGDAVRATIRDARADLDKRGLELKATYGDCVDLGATDRLIAMAGG